MGTMAPSAGPTARRTDPTRRDRIVAATLDLIAERGVSSVSYRALAEMVDVPLGSMTYHFPSRDELLFMAFSRFADDQFSILDQAMTDLDPDEDPRERLIGVIVIVADRAHIRREMAILAELYAVSIREERYAALTRDWMLRARDAIARHFDDGDAYLLDAVQEGLGLHRYFNPEHVDEALVRRAIETLAPQRPDQARTPPE